jgi:hypothetical protein
MSKTYKQSSRVQDSEVFLQEKAIARKATTKGTLQCLIPSPSTSCSLEDLARVCGFSLGSEEITRLANISMIQAKEEAMTALLNTKQKLTESSATHNDSDVRGTNSAESSGVQPALEIMAEGNRAMLDDTLSPVDQG